MSVQAIALMLLALIFFAFAGFRTLTNYECDWFICGDSLLPGTNNQVAIIEWLHHWSIIALVVVIPLLLILSIVVFRRSDEAVMIGIRNIALLFFAQALAALGSSIVGMLWQAPALHFLTAALLVTVAVVIVGWAMFSPNQDFYGPIFLGVSLVISLIPVVPYISVILF